MRGHFAALPRAGRPFGGDEVSKSDATAMSGRSQVLPSSDHVVGSIAGRLDRLPVMVWQWRGVIVAQLFWAALLMMDALVLRLYPVVWKPAETFSSVEYSFLVGFSNGLGPLVGVLVLGPMADKYGRKPVMVACCIISALTVPPLGFVDNYWVILTAVTLTGVGVGGALATVPAYAVEVVPPTNRSRLMLGGQAVGFFMLIFVGTGIGVALLPAHPELYVLTFSVIAFAFIPVVIFLLPESPRWLEAHSQYDKADRIVRKVEDAARSRGHELADPIVRSVQESEKVPARELFKGQYLKRTVVLLVVWVLIYIGINYGFQGFQFVYLADRGIPLGQILPMVFVSGLGAMAAVILGAVIGERIERKTYVLIAMIMFCIGLVMYYVAGDSLVAMYPATVITSFGLVACLATMYNYTAVAFPTRLRATGITVTDGVGHMGAVFGAAIAGIFYTATAGSNYIGWFLWIGIVGALLPGFILYFAGDRQSSISLEEVSE